MVGRISASIEAGHGQELPAIVFPVPAGVLAGVPLKETGGHIFWHVFGSHKGEAPWI